MTLNRNISCRQAEETAGTRHQFETPQAELKWLKENRQDLKGFVRVLEIIEAVQKSECPFIAIDQGSGLLDQMWLDEHSDRCTVCVGALLCWFFGTVRRDMTRVMVSPRAAKDVWEFDRGIVLLTAYLKAESAAALQSVIYGMSGDEYWNPETNHGLGCLSPAYNGADWPVGHLEVFRELARQFPHK